MIKADLHLHTCFSHGENTPFEMHHKAMQKGLAVIGFSEHSPRPEGYNFRHEYRQKLLAHMDDYVRQVNNLKASAQSNPLTCQVLFGMEMDWFDDEQEFMGRAARAYDFDYLIGSVHFLDTWGFDDQASDWEQLSQEECENLYNRYFHSWKRMIQSQLFQIAAHPDLIKIFSVNQFHIWLNKPESQALIKSCLVELLAADMAMEISSAGLRKSCQEIYPHPLITGMAARLGVPVALASDAHKTDDLAAGYKELEQFASGFGYRSQIIFDHGSRTFLPYATC